LQARDDREREEREIQEKLKELTTFSDEDLELLEQQSAEQLYIARKTNWRYHRELRANLGICRVIRRRKTD
jgi:hypothetical protein